MKKLYLEFIRGGAAVVVLLYHFIELHPTGNGPKHYYLSNWGTDAVIIFFILSGIVINISQTNNPKSKKDFISNRLLRIYPQLLAGIVMGLIVLYLTWQVIPSIGVIIGNLMMVSALKTYMNNIVPTIASNGPIWSLSYEMFFYLLFALAIGRFQKKAIIAWFAISLAVLPLYYSSLSVGAWGHVFGVITFSSIWLVGYHVYEYRNYFYADKYVALFSAGALPMISRMHLSTIYYDPIKYLLFAIFAIPFFRYCLQLPKAGKKIKWYYIAVPYLFIVYTVFTQPYITFTNWVLYGGLPLGLVTICYFITVFGLQQRVINFINSTGKSLGKYSFSIYISHYPVLFFCAAFFHNLLLYALVSLPCIVFVSYCLETYLQPAAISLFKKQTKIRLSTPQLGWFVRWARA